MTAGASFTVWERRTTAPSLVFDLVDRFARDRGTAGPGPRPRGRVRYYQKLGRSLTAVEFGAQLYRWVEEDVLTSPPAGGE